MKAPYIVRESLAEAFTHFDVSLPLAVDSETIGFYGKIRLVQLYQRGHSHVSIVEWPEHWALSAYLDKFTIVMHNAHYDITTIQQQQSSRWIPEKFEDTFLLARLFFCKEESFSLDDVMRYTLGYCPYEKQNLDKAALQKSNWSAHVLTPMQLQYAATDVFFLLDVYEAVRGHEVDMSYVLDKLTLRYCLDFQWNGMPLDKAKMQAKYKEIQDEIKAYNMPINVNSWQQVRKYIGETGSDALALMTFWLRDGNKKAKDVTDVRKLIKQLSFLDKFDRSAERIFGKFLPSARSGRLTSKDQNLQQLPRKLKGMFGVDDDRVLIYADYAQIELRSICAITACQTMLKLFREGVDLHSFTAEMIFGKDWIPVHRQISKTCNFNMLYGGGILMFLSILITTAEIMITEVEGNDIRKKWRNLWKEIYAWQEVGISNWKKGKLGSTPLGRRYSSKMMTDQLNIENQGAAAEVFKLALHYFLKSGPLPEGVFICNVIHDSFIIEAPNDPEVYQAVSIRLAEAMQMAWFEMSKLFKIKDLPMPVDIKVGSNWGDIENSKVPNIWEYSLDPYAMLEAANAAV